ncbi:LysR family transcriptional regulator [Cohnella endophytica]|uniref:LysR family transcriptional regulator n=1 Tax=Cohnella endophytica TaxID=2419778 RepID=A0A494Y6F8_9BACL|nr:LysR family transcriptional regulator [Cohnella endophytica]RKP58257.1 LysR family transcriptional regulator [Cohnella endophytica]
MEVRHLVYFLEIAKFANFTRASESLHVSQPNLSKAIKLLENELGVTLFNRTTRTARLTEAGELLRLHAQGVANSLSGLQSAISDLTELRRGSIKIGIPPLIGARLFPGLIAKFIERHPAISLSFMEHGSKVLEQSVQEGTLEMAVVMLPVDESKFHIEPIINRVITLGVHPSHPLARREEVRIRDLRNEKFILFGNTFKVNISVREACIREGFEPNIIFESSHWDFIFEMVAANLGITLMPEVIFDRIEPDRIRVIRSLNPPIPWNVAIIWRKDDYLSHAARSFIDFARQAFHP